VEFLGLVLITLVAVLGVLITDRVEFLVEEDGLANILAWGYAIYLLIRMPHFLVGTVGSSLVSAVIFGILAAMLAFFIVKLTVWAVFNEAYEVIKNKWILVGVGSVVTYILVTVVLALMLSIFIIVVYGPIAVR